MKRVLFIVTLLFCMTFAGSATAQNDSSTTFTFAGFNYQGDVGVVFGTGQTFGRVTVVPFARFSIDSTVTEEIRFKKTFGAETIIWLYRTKNMRFGLIGSLANLDWLENQTEAIGVYVSQAAGASLHWYVTDDFALNFSARGKTNLFSSETLYQPRFDFYLVAVTNKLDFLKLF